MSYTKVTGLAPGGAAQSTDQILVSRGGHTYEVEVGSVTDIANSAILPLQANVSSLQGNISVLQGNISALQASLQNTAPAPSGVTAGSYIAGGIEAMTVDQYGRVLAITGTNSAHTAWRLRVDHTAGSGDQFCSLSELQFRTVAGTDQQATGGTPFSTATGNGTYPTAAFDGDSVSRWVADYPNKPFPKYLGYIYASPITVAEMTIQASGYNTEAPTSGALEYSDDTTTGLDGTWNLASLFSTTGDWAAAEIRAFENVAVSVPSVVSNVALLQAEYAALTTNVSLNSNAITFLQTNVAVAQSSISSLSARVTTLENSGSAGSGSGTSNTAGNTATYTGALTMAALANAGLIPGTLDFGATIKKPMLRDFTFLDAGTTRTSDGPLGVNYFSNAPMNSSLTVFTQFFKPVTGYDPSTGITMTAGFSCVYSDYTFQGGGLIIADSSNRMMSIETIRNNAGFSLEQNVWSSYSSYDHTTWSDGGGNATMFARNIYWFKLQFSGSGMNAFVSPDGVDWWQVVSNNTYFTTPANAGFALKSTPNAPNCYLKGTLFHFDLQPGLL